MNNARNILTHIQKVIGSHQRTEREIDDFCSWIEVQVMTELFAGLPEDKQDQAIHQFMTLPLDKKESVFYPYYTVEYMRGKVKTATQKVILTQVVEPHWDQLSPSQQESIRSLLGCDRAIPNSKWSTKILTCKIKHLYKTLSCCTA